MAVITSNGTGGGDFSAGATWAGGVAPTSADDAVIASGDTVYLDTTGLQANTIIVNAGGILSCRDTTWDVTTQVGMRVNSDAEMVMDLSVSPTNVGTIYFNALGGGANNTNDIRLDQRSVCDLRGFHRTRFARLSAQVPIGATSATVSDATGWQVGDVVVFAGTRPAESNGAADFSEEVILTAVTGNTIEWSGGLAYEHNANGGVGNLTSNLTIRPVSETSDGRTAWYQGYSGSTAGRRHFRDVAFWFGGTNQYQGIGQLAIPGGQNGSLSGEMDAVVEDCAFYRSKRYGFATHSHGGIYQPVAIRRCVVWSPVSGSAGFSASRPTGFALEDCAVLRINGSSTRDGGISTTQEGNTAKRCYISGGRSCGIRGIPRIEDCEIESCRFGFRTTSGTFEVFNSSFSGHVYQEYYGGVCKSIFQSVSAEPFTKNNLSDTGPSKHQWLAVNGDPTLNYEFSSYYEISSDNGNFFRSTSSIRIEPTKTEQEVTFQQRIPCAAGASIRVIGYCKHDASFYNAGDYTPPSARLFGLGQAEQVYTATVAANGDWEQFDLTITNSTANGGDFILEYSVIASSVAAGAVNFDGVPNSPWITKARHYGFLFNESSPSREVDIYVEASESAAFAYTGVSYDNASKTLSFSAGSANTFQKFYDHMMALLAANLSFDLPFTRAGGTLLVDPSITIVDPLYAGELTWSGGVIRYSSEGSKADNIDGSVIEYNTAGATVSHSGVLSGTVDLRNLSASPMTVELPAGVNYTTANNTGGVITITSPSVSIKITAINSSGAPVASAKVALFAAAGGPLAEGQIIAQGDTNASGEFLVPIFSTAADQPVSGWVRKSSESPYYKTGLVQGVVSATNGASFSVVMVPDE